MNNEQISLLYALRDVAREQKGDSSYYDSVKGGTSSDNFPQIGKYNEVEAIAKQLPQYIILLNRGLTAKGLVITQEGINWVTFDEDVKNQEKNQADELKAEQEATQQVMAQAIAMMSILKTLPNFDQVVTDIFTRGKELGI